MILTGLFLYWLMTGLGTYFSAYCVRECIADDAYGAALFLTLLTLFMFSGFIVISALIYSNYF